MVSPDEFIQLFKKRNALLHRLLMKGTLPRGPFTPYAMKGKLVSLLARFGCTAAITGMTWSRHKLKILSSTN